MNQPHKDLIKWYIEQKVNILSTSEGTKFLQTLKEKPQQIAENIFQNMHNDYAKVMTEQKRAFLFIFSKEFAQSITDNLRLHFLPGLA